MKNESINQTTSGKKKGGIIWSKKKLRGKIAERADEILEVLFTSLHSNNPNLKLGAAKILINKILPDLKATELSAKDNKSLNGLITIKYENNQSIPVADNSSTGQS